LNRRDLLIIGSVAVALPLAARAQQKTMPVIGVLGVSSPGLLAPYLTAFRQGLSETGYVEGQNLAFEYRWAESHFDRLPALAADLVARKVDLIVTIGGTPAALAAKSATATIPILFSSVGDPVRVGLIASLAHPGGNVTGFSNIAIELIPKQLELLADLVPQARVIAFLVNPNNPGTKRIIGGVQEAARTKGVQLAILTAGTESEIDTAFASSPNCAPAVSSLTPIRPSPAGSISSLCWRRAMPSQRSIRAAHSSPPAA
jgi:ABC-type uncharacterized transport system substrate-binding protein